MDDDEKKPGLTWDAVEIGFVLLIAVLVIQGLVMLPTRLRNAPADTLMGKWGKFVGINKSLSEGVPVLAREDAYVYGEPNGDFLAMVRKETKGRITEGPSIAGNETWWRVFFESEEDGWVREIQIERDLTGAGLKAFGSSLWYFIRFFGTFLSLILLFGIVMVTWRFHGLIEPHQPYAEEVTAEPEAVPKEENKKWLRVLDHTESLNPNDWRLAILEADIMLDDMLEIMGYRGPTLGDKLKTIEPSDFTNLDKAWEAHRTRNLIAHEGADFQISQREARRIINLYKDVFKEFRYI